MVFAQDWTRKATTQTNCVPLQKKRALVIFVHLLTFVWVRLYLSQAITVHAWHLFPVLAEDRNGLRAYLEEKGISCQIHYPVATHLHKAYRDLGYKEGDFPVAEYNAAHELSLPLYYGLTDDQISYVIEVLNRF